MEHPEITHRESRSPASGVSRAETTNAHTRQEHRFLLMLILVFAGLASGIMTVGYLSYRNYAAHYRAQVESQLSAIAELKVTELVQWRAERMGDASVIFANASFSALVARVFADPNDIVAERQIHEWMAQYAAHLPYDQVRLLDTQGATRLSEPAHPPPVAAAVRDRIASVVQSGELTMTDVYRHDSDGRAYMTTLVPILDNPGRQRVIGILALRVDPEQYLFPYIRRWPTASQTAETLLVRRDGNDVLFLNELRLQQHTALVLRIPVTRTDVLAVKAALGQTGIAEGVDYRGVPAIGDLRPVPGSPWFLVARIETAEVFAPVRARLWEMVVIAGALLVASASGVGMVWRQQRVRTYRERYEAATALREIADKLRRAEAMGHLGHWSLDLRSQRVFWSDEVFRIHGVAVADGNLPWETEVSSVHPDDRANHSRAIAAIQRDGTGVFEYRVLRPDDDVRHVAAYGELGRDAAGDPVSIFGTVLDVTELRQKERELQETNNELARFTYTVSHDLKSPLVTITTFLGFLEQDTRRQDAERMEKDLAFIRGAADKMARLLDELLELSRVGRKMNPFVEVPLKAVVQEAQAIVAGQIAARGVQVSIVSEPVLLYGDRRRLVEVFQNLFDNAIKFMGDEPAPRVEIGTRPQGADIVVFVRDNGIGIDPRHQHKLFGLFEKLDPGAEGTGMGLALARRIVDVHGGRIWVESEGAGKGATFCFTLAKTRRAPTEEQKP